MAKKKLERPGYGKLLDAWSPPADAGEPIGCLVTSYTFDAVFFEEQCLSRFLHLETDADEDGPAYLIEREEKLAQVRCAAALVDQHHCRGSRNLRWNLLSARVKQAILHAKVSLLVWSNRIRLIVASANLTEDGYRRNQEVFGVLDYHVGADAPLAVLTEAITFIGAALETAEPLAIEPSAVLLRCQALLAQATELAARWKLAATPSRRRPLNVVPVFSGPNRVSVLEQLRDLWPASHPATGAHVLSPFFDPPESQNLPASAIWDLLRKRGDTSAEYYVVVERHGDQPPFIHAPESLARSAPADRPRAVVAFHELNLDHRPLHAKGIYLHDDRWIVYLLGSSNFTRAGLGLQGPANIEANLAYIADCDTDASLRKSIDQAFPSSQPLDVEEQSVTWKPIPNEDEPAEAEQWELPAAFGAALYEVDSQGRGRLRLNIAAGASAGWILESESDKFVAGEAGWQADGSAAEWTIAWMEDRPPSGLWVKWPDRVARAWWPVNIANQSALPPPEDLHNLTLEMLINILTSARPLHRVLADYLRRRNPGDGEPDDAAILDPHKRVDVSQFLLQRTRRVSAALRALAERLARPVATEESLAWRLRGPIGVEAVAKAILNEAKAQQASALQSFLIAELALELSRVEPVEAAGSLPAARVKAEIAALTQELQERHALDSTDAPPNLRQYIARAFAATRS
jgi:hypothetical protein